MVLPDIRGEMYYVIGAPQYERLWLAVVSGDLATERGFTDALFIQQDLQKKQIASFIDNLRY